MLVFCVLIFDSIDARKMRVKTHVEAAEAAAIHQPAETYPEESDPQWLEARAKKWMKQGKWKRASFDLQRAIQVLDHLMVGG